MKRKVASILFYVYNTNYSHGIIEYNIIEYMSSGTDSNIPQHIKIYTLLLFFKC